MGHELRQLYRGAMMAPHFRFPAKNPHGKDLLRLEENQMENGILWVSSAGFREVRGLGFRDYRV